MSPERLGEALARSGMDRVRAAQERGGLDPAKGFSEGFTFARSGTPGGWRDAFSDDDLEYARRTLADHGLGAEIERDE